MSSAIVCFSCWFVCSLLFFFFSEEKKTEKKQKKKKRQGLNNYGVSFWGVLSSLDYAAAAL